MATTSTEMNDAELFQAALADAPADTAVADAEKPAGAAEQPRDDLGRFASRPAGEPPPVDPGGAVAKPDADAGGAVDPGGHIPPWRLQEVTAERNELRSRLEQVNQQSMAFQHQLRQMHERISSLQQPAEQPDFYQDPNGATAVAIDRHVSPHLQAIQRNMIHNSQLIASAVHGADLVRKADDAFTKAYQSGQLDPADYQRVIGSPNIYDAAVQWYRRQEMHTRIGGDLDGFLKKHEEGLMKDAAFRQRFAEFLRAEGGASNGQRPAGAAAVSLPPSLGRVPAAAANTNDVGDLSDASLFAYATAKR